MVMVEEPRTVKIGEGTKNFRGETYWKMTTWRAKRAAG
jgi:hypothetical protein